MSKIDFDPDNVICKALSDDQCPRCFDKLKRIETKDSYQQKRICLMCNLEILDTLSVLP